MLFGLGIIIMPKIRVKAISNDRMVFDWAYQLVEGEQQLKSNRNASERKTLPKKVIKK